MSPDEITTALAHALMDLDSERYGISSGLADIETRADFMPHYTATVERVVLPRLWEAGLATWVLGQEDTA